MHGATIAHYMGFQMKELVRKITRGKVVCMPTDTVYGLVCSAKSPQAVQRLYEVKGRENRPGTIIAASIEQLIELGFNKNDVQVAAQFLPGPVSVVLPAPDSLIYLHMGLDSLAVRIPANKKLQELLSITGPLATTSANRPGEPTVTNIDQAREIFAVKVALYVDGGEITSQPSTIMIKTEGGFNKLR